jgi:serine/threonine protein phosphatase PrpC
MIEGRDFGTATTIGARSRQEDDWGVHVQPPALEEGALLLAGVADGMGGMPDGARASAIAIRTFFDGYALICRPARARLRHALAHANREVGIAVEARPELAGMGCTLVVVLFFADRGEWLSVGDSFVLRWRDGGLERINPLHTYASELDAQVERGEISADVARDHPDRAALTSAIQGGLLEEVAQGELDTAPGDIVMLASDGLATLSDDEIALVCAESTDQSEPARRIANTLIERVSAYARPSQDNATVIVVRIGADGENIVGGSVSAVVKSRGGSKRATDHPPREPRAGAETPEPQRVSVDETDPNLAQEPGPGRVPA